MLIGSLDEKYLRKIQYPTNIKFDLNMFTLNGLIFSQHISGITKP